MRSARGQMQVVMVKLSINQERGAISPQILDGGIKIDAEKYIDPLDGRVSPNVGDAHYLPPHGPGGAQ